MTKLANNLIIVYVCMFTINVFSQEYDYQLTGLPVCYIETIFQQAV